MKCLAIIANNLITDLGRRSPPLNCFQELTDTVALLTFLR